MSSTDILPSEEELLRDIEEPSAFQKKIRKIMVFSIAIFLLLLIVGYFIFGDVWHILEGKIGSYRIDSDYVIENEFGTIVFSKETYNKILETYLDNQETEVAFCLKGRLEEKRYYLEDFYIPPTKDKEVFSVTSQICDSETLIAFHTHPYKHCIFSDVDIEYYNSFKQLNPQGMIGVMCEPNRFTFYKE